MTVQLAMFADAPNLVAMQPLVLRPYQAEGCDAIDRDLARHRSTLFILPTGCGKTICFAETAYRFRPHGRTLVMAHREELIVQACDKIRRSTPLTVGIEMADQRVHAPLPDVVVASVQTLSRTNRRERFARDAFALIVVDEAHHAVSATYRSVLDYFAPAKVLGVTATSDRLDKLGMHNVFESVAYSYSIKQAIEDKALVPIKQQRIYVKGFDLSKVRVVKGDLSESDLERTLLSEEVLHRIASPLIESVGNRSCLVFTPGVKSAHALAEVLCRYHPGIAKAVDGTTPPEERKAAVSDFSEGRLHILVNCMLFTEGFDAPIASCVAIARPTKSRSLYTQMIGRGTRLHPESRKIDLLVMDFVGNSGRHSLISPLDILGGDKINQATRKRAERVLENHPEMDVLEAIETAKSQLSEEARLAAEAAKRAAEAEQARRAKITAAANFEATEVDPFAERWETPAFIRRQIQNRRADKLGPSEKQIEVLRRNGITSLADMTRSDATAKINEILDRQRRGLCTLKQEKTLAKHGLRTDMTFEEARFALDAIQQNGWSVPFWLREKAGKEASTERLERTIEI